MAYISFNELWESKFDNVSKKDKVQVMNIKQLKLKVHDIYEKDEKTTTNFKAVNDEDVINITYPDENISEIDHHLSFLEKDYNQFKLHYNKQSVERILIHRAVRMTIKVLYFQMLIKVIKVFLFVTRKRVNLEKVNVDVTQ